MDRRIIGAAVVLVAAVLILAMKLDISTMSLRQLTDRETKQTFGIAGLAILVLFVLAGRFPGSGPKPPRHP